MKKYNLLKTILITFLIFVLLSWIIKGGVLYNGEFYKAEASTSLGIGDIFSLPFQTFYLFAEYGLIYLLIGGMYGVFNETGVYKKIVLKIANIFKNKRIFALITSSIFILSFQSIFDNFFLTFTFIPFLVSILIELKYDKYQTMLATFGSALIGNFASLTGLGSLINYLLDTNLSNMFLARILIFLVTVLILVIMLILANKKTREEAVDILIPTEEKNKSTIPLIVIFILFIFVSIIGLFNWENCLNIKIFSNFSSNYLSKITLLNGFKTLGTWGTEDFAAIIIITILLVSIIYRIKFSNLIDAFKKGAKPMLKLSFYATLCSILFMYYYRNEEGYNLFDTILNKIYGKSNDLLVLKTAIATPIYSILLNNPLFLANGLGQIVTNLTTNTQTLGLAGLTIQLANGLSNLILPTSCTLIVGLAYFDIPYHKWLGYIWKIFLMLFLISGIIILA